MTIRLINLGKEPFCVSVGGVGYVLPPGDGKKYVSDVEPVLVKNKKTGEMEENGCRRAVYVPDPNYNGPPIPNFADLPDDAAHVLSRGDVSRRMHDANIQRVDNIVASIEEKTRQAQATLDHALAQRNAIIEENLRLKAENERLGNPAMLEALGKGGSAKEKR